MNENIIAVNVEGSEFHTVERICIDKGLQRISFNVKPVDAKYIVFYEALNQYGVYSKPLSELMYTKEVSVEEFIDLYE